MTEITYATEKIDQWYDDIQPLLKQLYKEVAVNQDIELDPDWGFYRRACSSGLLSVYTARVDRKLVGYVFYFVLKKHHHYSQTSWAVTDIIDVAPEYRRHGIANGLLAFAETDLKKRGVVVIQTNAKTEHPELAMLLESRGYRHTEDGYSKRM
jgi:GNAT superfamily N-acetyltransferase